MSIYEPPERFRLVDREHVDLERPQRALWVWRFLAWALRASKGTWLYNRAHGVAWRVEIDEEKHNAFDQPL